MEFLGSLVFTCTAICSVFAVCMQCYMWSKPSQERQNIEVRPMIKWLRHSHILMCASFITSTISLATFVITCSQRHASHVAMIKNILTMIMVFEIQSLLTSSICNRNVRRKLPRVHDSILVLFSFLLIVPVVATLMISVYTMSQMQGVNVPLGALGRSNTTEMTTSEFVTPDIVLENETILQRSTTAAPTHWTTVHANTGPTDSLLALMPLLRTKNLIMDSIAFVSTSQGLSSQNLKEENFQANDLETGKPVCWVTWPSNLLLVSFAFGVLSSCYGFLVELQEFFNLRSELKRLKISLEEWTALAARPTLTILALLKWTAVSLQWYSPSCIFSVCASTFLFPFLLPFTIGPCRCQTSGRIKQGWLSKRLKFAISRPYLVRCKHLRTASFKVGINAAYKRNISPSTEEMLQLEETGRNHVNDDVMINQRLSQYALDRDVTNEAYDLESCAYSTLDAKHSKAINDSEDEGYGVLKPKDCDVVDVAGDLAKCQIGGQHRRSVFDDSDYDEVMDFMTSPTPRSRDDLERQMQGSIEEQCKDEHDVNNSSKRSSAASSSESVGSVASSGVLSSSGVESSDEKPNPKYANLDVAKILHTRKRIQRILHTPAEDHVAAEPSDDVAQNLSISSSGGGMGGKKKSASLYKRHTSYGTLGRRSKSSSKRASSIPPRPLSGGESELTDPFQSGAGDYATLDPLRARRDTSAVETYFTYDGRTERPKSRDSDSDGSGFDSKRWSRLSTNSANSDKLPSAGQQKGPFKALKRFVYNSNSSMSNSTRNLSHEEKKAMIQICVSNGNETNNNSNNNNNNCSFDEDGFRSRGEYSLSHDPRRQAGHSCIPVGSVDATSEYTFSASAQSRQRSSNSLMRKFSRKSPRGRDPRRSSLPAHNMLDVRSGSQPPSSDVTPPFQYGDGAQRANDIESRVMESVEQNSRGGSAITPKSPQKSNTLKRRFLSFAKRRPSMKRSPSKPDVGRASSSEAAPTMNKSLSYSSPQLSVFAVNSTSGSGRTNPAQKLLF